MNRPRVALGADGAQINRPVGCDSPTTAPR